VAALIGTARISSSEIAVSLAESPPVQPYGPWLPAPVVSAVALPMALTALSVAFCHRSRVVVPATTVWVSLPSSAATT
jgi:hypothetical protein